MVGDGCAFALQQIHVNERASSRGAQPFGSRAAIFNDGVFKIQAGAADSGYPDENLELIRVADFFDIMAVEVSGYDGFLFYGIIEQMP